MHCSFPHLPFYLSDCLCSVSFRRLLPSLLTCGGPPGFPSHFIFSPRAIGPPPVASGDAIQGSWICILGRDHAYLLNVHPHWAVPLTPWVQVLGLTLFPAHTYLAAQTRDQYGSSSCFLSTSLHRQSVTASLCLLTVTSLVPTSVTCTILFMGLVLPTWPDPGCSSSMSIGTFLYFESSGNSHDPQISFGLPSKARKVLWGLVPVSLLWLPYPAQPHCFHITCLVVPWAGRVASSLCARFLENPVFCCTLGELKRILRFLLFLYRVVSAFWNWINHRSLWATAHPTAPPLLRSKLLFMSSSFPLDCECLRAGTESYSSLYHQLLAQGHIVNIK